MPSNTASLTKAPKPSYRCSECGWSSPKWLGQCRECRAWGTLEEVTGAGGPGAARAVPAARPPPPPAPSGR
ncbi:DNA repair protein radA [Actinomyces denticolens]|nr:DNA repair protein radA [Actinomyces denticolens]